MQKKLIHQQQLITLPSNYVEKVVLGASKFKTMDITKLRSSLSNQ
jgi:hypothetical protein